MLEAYYKKGVIEAGCDEAGRGCLAGPVFAAAVILPPDFENEVLNDSKQLTEKKRYQLREVIEHEALAWAVGIVDNQEIDRINILNASILAMHRALDQLKLRPQNIIVDGNRWKPYQEPTVNDNDNVNDNEPTANSQQPIVVPATTIVKGDGKYLSIAAASILAKTYRDDFMLRIHEEFPQYHWDKNKGYPAKVHREAIRQFGTTPYHRLSFNLLGNTQQLEFDFDNT